jgi:hypothetical protein
MKLKINKRKKEKLVEVTAIPEEYNPYGKFKGKLLGTIEIKDPDWNDSKIEQSVVRRSDTKEVCFLHPAWYKISSLK